MWLHIYKHLNIILGEPLKICCWNCECFHAYVTTVWLHKRVLCSLDVPSVQQKSSGRKFCKSRTGSHV